jgi:hypothetical protein
VTTRAHNLGFHRDVSSPKRHAHPPVSLPPGDSSRGGGVRMRARGTRSGGRPVATVNRKSIRVPRARMREKENGKWPL